MRKRKGIKARTHRQISISLPAKLLEFVDDLAQRENRNRSNCMENIFEKLAESFEKKEQP